MKEPKARRDAPDTSHKAAEAARIKQPTIRKMVEEAARAFGAAGFIDTQLYPLMPQHQLSSVRTRRQELCADDIIFDSGKREKNDRADSRNQQAAPETGKADVQCARDERTQEGANDADDEIGNQAVLAAHDLLSDPAGKDADDHCAKDGNFIHDATPLLVVQRDAYRSVPAGLRYRRRALIQA